jgi:hypothetical protein
MRPEGWRYKTWMQHHNNTPAHTPLLVHELLTKHERTVILQPPYSTYLAPAEFFFVPEIEIRSEKSPILDDRRDSKNSLQDLCAITQNSFQDAFWNWKIHWKWCINIGGEYLEGGKSY